MESFYVPDAPKITQLPSPPVLSTDAEIPSSRAHRDALGDQACAYVQRAGLIPPLSLDELQAHSQAMLASCDESPTIGRYALVLLSNAVWRDAVAAVPFTRRLFLLPQCLRDMECPATIDAIGLTCEHCGRCVIDELTAKAAAMGYVTLVAEGSSLVMSLIEAGKVDAIVGVSCLATLERVFPYMQAGAVPGVAIPLLRSGCANTAVDLDVVYEAMELTAETTMHRLPLGALREAVRGWFDSQRLQALLGEPAGETQQLGIHWLKAGGKRWRPFLAVAVHQALRGGDETNLPAYLPPLAVAIECFHKASLLHDDIADSEPTRYDAPTLHITYDIPTALNVGDLLLGEGYRLLADACREAGVAVETAAAMLRVAAEGHRTLCLGQGEELAWRRTRDPLSLAAALRIAEHKTAPAFEVALQLGRLASGLDDAQGQALAAVLHEFSVGVGVAYQIRDDWQDLLYATSDASDLAATAAKEPNVLLALAWQGAGPCDRTRIEAFWRGGALGAEDRRHVRERLVALDVEASALVLLEQYKRQALASIEAVPAGQACLSLKSFLRRVVGNIFYDVPQMGCCEER